MKSSWFYLFFAISLCSTSILAQDDGERAYKKAKRALGAYNLDQNANKDKLDEASAAIQEALNYDLVQSDAEAWILKGQIAIEECTRDITMLMLNSNARPLKPMAALEGLASFEKALSIAEKKYVIKDALKGLSDIIMHLQNMAYVYYEKQDIPIAHKGFSGMVTAHDLLISKGEKSPLDEKAYHNAVFSAAATCTDPADRNRCNAYLDKLVKANYPNAYIYDLLYNAWYDTDKAKAVKYLEEGRVKYPDEVTLLFTEINHYLREGRMSELVGKLESAIAKEPDNKSLYLTLGNVYDNLSQKSREANDKDNAETNFNSALKYYQQALEKDPNYLDATYSIGALYYNRAAHYQQQLNMLADDYSKEGLKKYNELKAKVDGEFDLALPFFKRAEQLEPNDTNTLIALKEIFARKNDLTTSAEFKNRLDKVQKGEKNTSSYFGK